MLAGIEIRTVATSALTVRRSNHSARFYSHSVRIHQHSARSNIEWSEKKCFNIFHSKENTTTKITFSSIPIIVIICNMLKLNKYFLYIVCDVLLQSDSRIVTGGAAAYFYFATHLRNKKKNMFVSFHIVTLGIHRTQPVIRMITKKSPIC
jgi:hypothetical protein